MSRRFATDEESTPWSDSEGQEWNALAPAVAHSSEESTETTAEQSSTPGGPRSAGRHAAWGRGERTGRHVQEGHDQQAGVGSGAGHTGPTNADIEPAAGSHGAKKDVSSARADRPAALRLRQFLVAVAVPLAVLMLSVRAVATSAFLWVEYHRPGFPADSWGSPTGVPFRFSTEDRLTFGSYGLDYVQNFAPESYLGSLKLPDGTTAFSMAEVQHMTDVKHVLAWASLAVTAIVLLAILGTLGLGRKAPGATRRAVFVGAVITLVLLVALCVLSLVGWESFFIRFHEVFFPGGNWAFLPSDTLIRLYPDAFWKDAAITIGALSLIMTLILLIATWPTARRRQKDLRAKHERQDALEARG